MTTFSSINTQNPFKDQIRKLREAMLMARVVVRCMAHPSTKDEILNVLETTNKSESVRGTRQMSVHGTACDSEMALSFSKLTNLLIF